jgi:hypothetical protein
MRPLKPAQVDRAKMLMSSLKLISGYRNKEICQAVKRSWSESTINLYTRGIIPSKSRTIPAWKTDLTRLLLSLIQQRISVDDILMASQQKKYMDSKNITFEDVSNVINQAEEYGMSLKHVLISYYNLSQRTELTTEKVSILLSIMSKLDDHNILPEFLDKMLLAYTLWQGDKRLFLIKLKDMVSIENRSMNS